MNELESPERRAALRFLVASAGSAGLVACGGGGEDEAGTAAAEADVESARDAWASALQTSASPRPASVLRLQAAARAVTARMPVTAVPIEVSQGQSNVAEPSLGALAQIVPTPLGSGVRPNPVSLQNVPQVWGFRRESWSRFAGAYAGTTQSNGSWFQPVRFIHQHATTKSDVPCAFHFVFDGRAFEVLFGGTNVQVTLIADGTYMAPQTINRTLRNGVQGASLAAYDTYVRFDFGSAAPRRISLYCTSTLGPSAVAFGAGDTLQAWDRSAEPTLAVQADSYGQAPSTQWGQAGIFFEAALRLGIPNVDIDAVGGTAYAANSAMRDAGDSFTGRLASMTRAAPDLFLTAGGINDNNWLALAPYATGEQARADFEATVRRYFQVLRAALPNTVLAAIGPWQPQADFYPQSALDKADTIRAALQAVAGPWVFLDNLRGGGLTSSGASSPATGIGWQTGTGNVARPRGDGNGDRYVSSDGIHPSLEGSDYLGRRMGSILKAAIATL